MASNKIYKNLFYCRKLRSSVLSFACLNGLPLCINKAKSIYNMWMNNPTSYSVSSNYRSTVYCTAIRHGGEKEWSFAMSVYLKETDSKHKDDLQYGMSCAKEPFLINTYLQDQLDETKVRSQDTLRGLSHAASNGYAYIRTWNFVKENWNIIFDGYH